MNERLEDLVVERTAALSAEIAVRKRAEEALADEAIRRRILVEQSRDGIVVLDQNGRVYEANRRYAEMLGYTREEVQQLHVWDWDFQWTREQLLEMIRLVDETGDHFETIHRRKDGSLLDVEISTNGAVCSGQKLVFCVCRDISDRKRAEKALRESEEKYRLHFKHITDVIYSLDSEFRISSISPSVEASLGYKPEELIGKRFTDLNILTTESLEKGVKYALRTFSGETISDVEYEFIAKDGSHRIAEISGAPLYAEEKIIGSIAIARDITERKRVEEELQETQDLLNEVGRIGKIGGWRMELITRQAFWTQGTYDIVEIDPGQPVPGPDEHVDYYLPEYRAMVTEAMRALIEENKPLDFEAQLRTAKGNVKWCRAIGVVIREDGEAVEVCGTFQDVTERKRAEEERERMLLRQNGVNLLQQSLLAPAPLDRKLKSITDSIVRLFDADFCRIWLIRPGDRCDQGCIHSELQEGPHVCGYRGRCLHLLSSSGRYTHTDGKGHCRVPFGCYKIGRVASGEERKFITNDVENDPRIHDHEWASNLGLVSFAGYQLRVPGRQTMGVLALFSKFPITPAEDAILDGLSSAIALVVQQAESEAALRESEEKHRILYESSRDAIMTIEPPDWRFTSGNPATVEMFGAKDEAEFTSKGPWDLSPERQPDGRLSGDKAKEMIEQAAKDGSNFFEWTHKRLNGEEFPATVLLTRFEWKGKMIQQGTVRDITEQKKLEEQFRQAMKMEAIGRLAGGIAHDFNNIMAVIISYSGFIINELKENDPMREDAQEIKDAAYRAAALTRQLLAFSRKEIIKPEILNLNNVITNLEKMLRRIIGEDLEFSTVLDKNLGNVKADLGQMEQVLANLAVNARDAMPDGGKLTIETKNAHLDEQYSHGHMSVMPGSYVMFAISDTGCGMDANTLSKIFEPFFTTKDVGKGTGLGLATVYGIICQNNGFILAYSEPGHGTSFKIYLPLIESFTVPVKAVKSSVDDSLKGSETILLVEDEDMVRKIAGRILRKNGYTVIEASNGGEALPAYERHNGPIHLLLTDVIMPLMSGKVLAERLKKLRPEIKVAYMSGYTNNAIAHQGVLDNGVIFVQKPFSEIDLLRIVRKALGTNDE